MARSKKRSPKVEQVRPYVEGVAKNLVDKLYGPDGPPWGTTLTDIEDLLLEVREVLTEQMLDLALARQAQAAAAAAPGPTPLPGLSTTAALCGRQPAHRANAGRRGRMVRAGRLLSPLPAGFFSLSPRAWASTRLRPARRCSRRSSTPASPAAPSPRPAQPLQRLADLRVGAKQVERLTEGIGAERVAQRDAAVAAFEALPLVEKFAAPAGRDAAGPGGGHGRWRPAADPRPCRGRGRPGRKPGGPAGSATPTGRRAGSRTGKRRRPPKRATGVRTRWGCC